MKTSMLQMPDPDDEDLVERHKRMVMETYGEVFSTIDDALTSALPRALTTFQLWEGAIDLAVHAPMVRYLVKQSLALHAVRTSDEDDVLFNLHASPTVVCAWTPEWPRFAF